MRLDSFHPSGKFAYVSNGNGQSVSVFLVDPGTGALIAEGPPVAVQQIPIALAFDGTGNFLYVGNNASNTISAFVVDPITGNLTPHSGSPFTPLGGNGPAWMSVDPTNQYLYVVNQGSDTVGVLAIDAAGGLSLKSSAPTGAVALSMALVK